MNITVSMFEAHLMYLNKYYQFVSLRQAVDYLETGRKFPCNSIVLTFDDGYRDNYTNAFPLLKKYKIPATIFLSVDNINKNRTLWYDGVSSAIFNLKLDEIDLRKFGLKIYNLRSYRDNISSSQKIIWSMKYMPADKRNAIITHIRNIERHNSVKEFSSVELLSWDDINEMKASGISFGSHGSLWAAAETC